MLNCLVLIEKWPFKKGEHLLAENELKKLKTFNSTYFISKSHFEEDVIVSLFSISADVQIFQNDCWCW